MALLDKIKRETLVPSLITSFKLIKIQYLKEIKKRNFPILFIKSTFFIHLSN
jgi:hypothetical protein